MKANENCQLGVIITMYSPFLNALDFWCHTQIFNDACDIISQSSAKSSQDLKPTGFLAAQITRPINENMLKFRVLLRTEVAQLSHFLHASRNASTKRKRLVCAKIYVNRYQKLTLFIFMHNKIILQGTLICTTNGEIKT